MDFLFIIAALGAVVHCAGVALSGLLGAGGSISSAREQAARAEAEQRLAYERFKAEQEQKGDV